jgi:hypothetical protein
MNFSEITSLGVAVAPATGAERLQTVRRRIQGWSRRDR